MAPVLVAYFETGLVERMPTWVFSLVLMLISFLIFTAGLILDSVSRARSEQLRIHYMSMPARSTLPVAPAIDDAPLKTPREKRKGAA